jgi:magnesium transporter
MINRHTYRDITWIDLESPTPAEVRMLVDEFGIHTLIAEELLAPTLRPKVDFYAGAIYLILHFPALKHTHRANQNQEIDFVIGKNFLITTRYETIDPLHKFSKVFEVNSILDRSNIGDHAGYLFYYMLKKIYKSLGHELESISDSLDLAETQTFKGNERAMVIELSRIARDLLIVKRSIALHGEVLESFRETARKLFDSEFDFYIRDIIGEFTKVAGTVRGQSEFLSELRSTNDSLLSTKQNETIRILTGISAVILPCSLVAAIFTIPAQSITIIGTTNDFAIIVGIMAFIGIGSYLFFRRKRWL